MRRAAPLTSLVALLILLLTVAPSKGAAAATVIESQSVTNGYPTSLTFKVTARADTTISDVTLKYSLRGRGTGALDKPKDLTPAKTLSAEVVIQVNSSNNYIPVGSEFTYHWEITTDDGQTFVGPDQNFFYLPPDKDWKNVSNDFMTVYYHGDRESIAQAYLKAGADTYDRIGKQLYGVELQQVPVKVILFGDEAESDLARPGSGGRFDAAVTTCGTKVTNDIILMIPIACGSSDRTDTLRHEFGHILNETAGEGTLAKLPSWLDEGAAVYAQSSPGQYETAFRQAVQQNRLIPFSQMNVPASAAGLVDVFYGESWAMVSYLIQKDGPQNFAKFMATIKGGRRFDQALSDVYGFATINDFESAFKQAVGSSQQATPTPRPTTAPTQRATVTRTPTRQPAAAATSNDDGRNIGRGTIVIGGVAAVFLLLAIFAMLITMMASNNRAEAARRAAAREATRPPAPPQDWGPPPDGPKAGD